ncbi:uncharacterized protein LOC112346051 isoform X2 [Selaginella moellendorffii]|uniref:uncharacterized protein LOC112346051 isoform X2 n=1 Tax=Selaginella moellendorffii TaxID=88036 RepID=UPI000D1CED6A|nr:uncharacterized protein LOC112346051 isoform X2 [Selaginella moellendorffii]|eukprot:XP_024529839.1 uncharacterized protein LOC112346051 isoform X2 [Selaginella moellendorffii]
MALSGLSSVASGAALVAASSTSGPGRTSVRIPTFLAWRRDRRLLRCDSARALSPASKTGEESATRSAVAASKPQDPLRSFPWDVAAKRFAARLSDLVWTALKWLTIPVLLVSSASELAYTLVHGKALFVPVSMLLGIALAGIMNEVAKEVSPSLRKGFPFHLVVIGVGFGLIKMPGPSYPFWGRIILPHFANGGLWQTCYLIWRGLR